MMERLSLKERMFNNLLFLIGLGDIDTFLTKYFGICMIISVEEIFLKNLSHGLILFSFLSVQTIVTAESIVNRGGWLNVQRKCGY